MSFSWLRLDEKKLSQQWIFRLAIAIPFTISFLLCIPLWFETTFDFSSTGYAKFLSIFSLPIGVLSLSIPLVAIVAHIHRTIQTEKQIELVNEKNTSDRFYSHHKYITETFSLIKSNKIKLRDIEIILEISNPYSLYRDFFPGSSPMSGVDLYSKDNYSLEITTPLMSINNVIKETQKHTRDNGHSILYINKLAINLMTILFDISQLQRSLGIKKTEIELTKQYKEILFSEGGIKYKITTYFINENELKNYLQELYYIIIKVLSLLDIQNKDYYTYLTQYVTKDNNNYFFNVFRQMKKTESSQPGFSFGKNAYTEDEFKEFSSLPIDLS
ncbi:hypothetical protein ABRQ05_11425 [Pectobacterium actinidiae]|uniref:hypothetical protein n=1 Tax=Pectobacterium actinidiae TaxID=1507808 RepID=UPI0032EC1378